VETTMPVKLTISTPFLFALSTVGALKRWARRLRHGLVLALLILVIPPHWGRTLALLLVLVGAVFLLIRAGLRGVFGWSLAPGAAPTGVLAVIVVLVCSKKSFISMDPRTRT
jgi:hypothetical protein